ncbi:hypothetical protein Patl1_02155 [Pistacia atlantica]|uniref:Uncharacterized protein n=1 Tax=Pistacia atlantica TaxID=434234 RepID=A0ACC1C913_9ROSI|nr:hypothetical protein Patl1_02155 [Pistacia atlantica]
MIMMMIMVMMWILMAVCDEQERILEIKEHLEDPDNFFSFQETDIGGVCESIEKAFIKSCQKISEASC